MSKQVAKILLKAKNAIRKKGWHQGCATGPNGELCAWWAIEEAGSANGYCAATDKAKERLRDVVGGSIWTWNDRPERTKRQVLGAFTRAINAELKANS